MPIRSSLSEVDLDRFLSYAKLFGGESDRGAALLAAAYLGSLLEDLLRAVMVDEKTIDSLFERNGPLANFSSQIDMAFALGFLPPAVRHDLHLIRKIRNYFAHHPAEVSFTTAPVSDMCRDLEATKWGAKNFDDWAEWSADSRGQFIMAVQVAMFRINRAKYATSRAVVPAQ